MSGESLELRDRSAQPLELRDVPGPTALGGGWRRARDLLYLMAVTEFKRTYFGTVLGYLWSLCRPLLLFAVLLVVFTHLLRFSTVPHYPVLLLMNIVLFGFILGFGIEPMWTWLLLPVLIAALTLLATAVSMILSSLYPRFRDVAIIWSVFSTALFYASPVLYPLQRLSGTIRGIVALNPLAPMLEL